MTINRKLLILIPIPDRHLGHHISLSGMAIILSKLYHASKSAADRSNAMLNQQQAASILKFKKVT